MFVIEVVMVKFRSSLDSVKLGTILTIYDTKMEQYLCMLHIYMMGMLCNRSKPAEIASL
jgi:hypothetical protein